MEKNNAVQAGNLAVPKDFFNSSSFGSLASSVVVAWIVTGAICSAFGIVDKAKIVLMCVSLFVSLAGVVILQKKPTGRQFLIAFFNGFLIYVSSVGINSITTPAEKTEKPKAEASALPAKSLAPSELSGDIMVMPGAEKALGEVSAFKTRWF